MVDLARRLEEFKQTESQYEFWPDEFSLSIWLKETGKLMPSGKLIDVYLLKLAAVRHGALATLDARITCELAAQSEPEIVEWVG